MAKQNHTGLIHKAIVAFVAFAFYGLGILLLDRISAGDITSVLSKGMWSISIFLVAEWQVRNKQNSITEESDEKFEPKEQRRLNAIISERNQYSTYRFIYFFLTAALLFFSPLLIKVTEISSWVIPICFVSLGVAFGVTLLNYIRHRETEDFNREIETRVAKRKRREELMKSLKSKEEKPV
jgi:hypothetical protein